jgi:hypothetical protein
MIFCISANAARVHHSKPRPVIARHSQPQAAWPYQDRLNDASIDPRMVVMSTPNTLACAESMAMNLATPLQ